MATTQESDRLTEAEECLRRASLAMLAASTELEWGDPWYSEVRDLADEVHALRRVLTDSIQAQARKKKARK